MRSRSAVVIDAAIRQLVVRVGVWFRPYAVVNEYPKSGGSWVAQMLGRALDLPFPRNRMPDWRVSVMHGHYIHPAGMRRVVCVWRDGRDVMASSYYHYLFRNERENAPLVEYTRSHIPFSNYDDVTSNLPSFVEYLFTHRRHPRFNWAEFVRVWHGRLGMCHVRYEDLRADTAGELQRIVRELTGENLAAERAAEIVDEYSFARQAGRQPGDEVRSSFMRKGVVGDWKNCFNAEARAVFARHAGEELIRLGYEKDDSWISDSSALS